MARKVRVGAWEEDHAKYHENKETDEALNFDASDNVDEYFLSDEDTSIREGKRKCS